MSEVTADVDAALAREAALQNRLTAANEANEKLTHSAATMQALLAGQHQDTLYRLKQIEELRHQVDALEGLLREAAKFEVGENDEEAWQDLLSRISLETVHVGETVPPATCTWSQDNSSLWNSTCGVAWAFMDGSPHSHGMHFCHSCGKTLVVGQVAGDGK